MSVTLFCSKSAFDFISMSDSEDISDSSDDDYIPHAEELSEEDESGEEEDLPAGWGEVQTGNRRKIKASTKGPDTKRKRTGGIKLDDADEDNGLDKEQQDEEDEQLQKEISKEVEQIKESEEKKKVDDLWSKFLSDVGPRPKPVSSKSNQKDSQTSSPQPQVPKSSTEPLEKKNKVTITKVFDFAGEEVKITKEVDANSKEAKVLTDKDAGSSPASSGSGNALPGTKRPSSGLSGVLGKIGKKPKMSVLDKSKHDWDTFKMKEGITEELQTHNRGKDGYLERKAFLEKVDYNQFEIERNLRQGKR